MKRGFAIIEILIAVSIISVSLIASGLVTAKALEASRQVLRETQASFLIEEGAEAVKIVRDIGWENIENSISSTTYYLSWTGTDWILSTTPSTIDSFTRTIVFTDVYRDVNDDIAASGTLDEGTRKVDITVTWSNSGEETNKTLSFYIANVFAE